MTPEEFLGIRDLVNALRDEFHRNDVGIHLGTVLSDEGDGTLTLALDGDAEDIQAGIRKTRAAANVGDVALIARNGADWTVVGGLDDGTGGGAGGSSALSFHANTSGSFWSLNPYTGSSQIGAVGSLSCAVPGPGNLHVTACALNMITFKSSPVHSVISMWMQWQLQVDGVASASGEVNLFQEEKINTFASGTFQRTGFLHAVVACPSAATRDIDMFCGSNPDLSSIGETTTVASISGSGQFIGALFVPGTPISDGGDFTP
jgi:hypothetical protein